MLTFKDFLAEGRDAPLYHGTDIDSAKGILKQNTLLDSTYHGQWLGGKHRASRPLGGEDHFIIHKDKSKFRGASLTRSYKTAYHWKSTWGKVVFEFDQSKLIQNYKIVPINISLASGANFFSISSSKGSKYEELFEEFIIGGIKDVRKYLISIIVNSSTFTSKRNNTNDLKALTGLPIKFMSKSGRIESTARVYNSWQELQQEVERYYPND